jgi:hypothetical protein
MRTPVGEGTLCCAAAQLTAHREENADDYTRNARERQQKPAPFLLS